MVAQPDRDGVACAQGADTSADNAAGPLLDVSSSAEGGTQLGAGAKASFSSDAAGVGLDAGTGNASGHLNSDTADEAAGPLSDTDTIKDGADSVAGSEGCAHAPDLLDADACPDNAEICAGSKEKAVTAARPLSDTNTSADGADAGAGSDTGLLSDTDTGKVGSDGLASASAVGVGTGAVS